MQLAVTPIVDRLKASGLAPVEGLLELKAMTAPPARLPAYFVVPATETAAPNQLIGARDQKVTGGFSVIVVLAGARRKETVNEELKEATGAVIDALAGWQHPDASAPTDYAGGRLMSGAGTTVEWEVRFSARYHLRRST